MKKLLNTLYVTSPGRYLSLDGENVVVTEEGKEIARLPLHNLEGIVTFGYTGASPALMGACAERDIALSFLSPNGYFLARVSGRQRGNILLRRKQYRVADNEEESIKIARNCIVGKIHNAKWVIERTCRDYLMRVDAERMKTASMHLGDMMREARACNTSDRLRGIEGVAAAEYFSVFDEMILRRKDVFTFKERSRRPPLDPVNAMLSFTYTLLTSTCQSALETVGLDPYAGFFHTDRPGRASLALDMIEELRSVMADRFVLSMINLGVVDKDSFITMESGAVVMTDETRKNFLAQWQKKKQEIITHPFLGEKVEWGMVPYVQAMLLARHLRGDTDEYPPFLWK